MIANIKAWLLAHNITAHTVGTVIVGFALAYTSSPDLRNYIATVFIGYPTVVTHFGVLMVDIAAAVTLWRNYATPRSDAGVMAAARVVAAKSDAPTVAQVDAATTK